VKSEILFVVVMLNLEKAIKYINYVQHIINLNAAKKKSGWLDSIFDTWGVDP